MIREKLQLAGYWAVAAIMLGLVAWSLRLDALRGRYRVELRDLQAESHQVLSALRSASDNPALSWQDAEDQARALGVAVKGMRASIDGQNLKIDDMARKAARLRAEASELQKIADQAREQRKVALARLSDMAGTPGTRDDCETLLREAETALDLVREAGL